MGSDRYFSWLCRVPQLDVGTLGPVLHFLPSIFMKDFEDLSDCHRGTFFLICIILLFYTHVNKNAHMSFMVWLRYGLRLRFRFRL